MPLDVPGRTRATLMHSPSLACWQQEVTDEQGRRRFHGAFTGGFSAGYFNTVGSKEGFTPATFRSSRSERGAASSQRVEDFLDQDELDERNVVQVETQHAYDTFGFTSNEAARRRVALEGQERQQIIPGPIIEEFVATDTQSWGVKMLLRMGWRQGRGIGIRPSAGALDRSSRWGEVAGVGTDNTPVYEMKAKRDRYGLSFDPYANAEEFRNLKRGRDDRSEGAPGKRRRGVAFGTGVLEEFDTYGEQEDYVTEIDSRADAHQEIISDEDEELMMQGGRMQGVKRLGAGGPAALQIGTAADSLKARRSIVRGFAAADNASPNVPHYPPPSVPKMFQAKHHFPASQTPEHQSISMPAQPAVNPPQNEELKHAADTLATFVAKNGKQFEDMARQRQGEDTKFAFLHGGDGAEYYRWRLQMEADKLRPARATPKLPSPPPLNSTARSQLLGEERLPVGAGHAPKDSAPSAPPVRVTSKVAEGDRQMLRSALGSKFASGEQQDMQGAPALPPGLAMAFTSRFATAGAVQYAPALQGGLAKPSEVSAALSAMDGGSSEDGKAKGDTVTRSIEDWWPEPLLCKRFCVPDPHKGKTRPAQSTGSRFMTDHLVLPETAASDAANAPKFLSDGRKVDSTPRLEREQLSTAHEDSPDDVVDAGELADAFLSSLMGGTDKEKGGTAAEGGGESAAASDAATDQPLENFTGKPIDLFKAIFEDSDSEDENEEAATNAAEEQRAHGQPPASLQHPSSALPAPNSLGNALVQASRVAVQKAAAQNSSMRDSERVYGPQEPNGPARPPRPPWAPAAASGLHQSSKPPGTDSDVLRILDALKKVEKLKKGKKDKKEKKKHSSKESKRKEERRREHGRKHHSSSSKKDSRSRKHKSSKSSRRSDRQRCGSRSDSESMSDSSGSSSLR